MPKAPPPSRNQRDCRFDQFVAAALAQGHGKVLVYNGIDTEERAHEVRKGLYRCAKHRGVTIEAGTVRLASGDEMGVHAVAGGYEVRYRTWPKSAGRAHLLRQHGSDRTAWPYDPRRLKNQEDIDSWQAQGLNEKGHRIR